MNVKWSDGSRLQNTSCPLLKLIQQCHWFLLNPKWPNFSSNSFGCLEERLLGSSKFPTFIPTVNFVPHTQGKVWCQISVMSSWPVPSHTVCSIVIALLHFWLILSIGIWFGILVLDKIHFPVTRRRKGNLQHKVTLMPELGFYPVIVC